MAGPIEMGAHIITRVTHQVDDAELRIEFGPEWQECVQLVVRVDIDRSGVVDQLGPHGAIPGPERSGEGKESAQVRVCEDVDQARTFTGLVVDRRVGHAISE